MTSLDAPETWVRFVRRWYGEDTIAFHRDHARTEAVEWSGPGPLVQDVFENPAADAPVMILLHGIQGHGRMLLPMTRALYRRGLTMVVPDLPGNGLSCTRETKGRIPVLDQLAGAEAVVRAAVARWPGRRLVVGGASLGAPFAFILGLRLAKVDALVAWTLFDPSDPRVLRGSGRLGSASGPFLKLMGPFSRAFPGTPAPAVLMLALEHVSDRRGFVRSLLGDPLVVPVTTLGVMQSMQRDLPPLLRWGEWDRPILVLQPEKDRMIPAAATEDVYHRLTGTTVKRLEILPGLPHLPAEVAPFEDAADRILSFLS